MQNYSKEPTLGEYGLSSSSYDNYRNQRQELEESLSEYKEKSYKSLSEFKGNISSGFFEFCHFLVVMSLVGILGPIITVGLAFGGNFIPLLIYAPFVYFVLSIESKNDEKIKVKESEIYEKIKLKEVETRENINGMTSKFIPFEEACIAYYEGYLEQFFQNNLYKKRSGSKEFEQSLAEFSSMIDEVENISKKLMFRASASGYSHKAYLSGRQINHNLQKEKKQLFHSFDAVKVKSDNEIITKNIISDPNEKVKEEFRNKQNQEIPQVVVPKVENEPESQSQKVSTDNLEKPNGEVLVFGQKVESNDFHRWTPQERDSIDVVDDTHEAVISESIREEAIVPQKKEAAPIVPPEKKYRTARKIDNWEEINRKRKITGTKGEEIALAIEQEYFESIGRKDLADRVRHVSVEDGDGLGYDILSFFDNGKEKYIEVKSTTVSIGSPFNISKNELEFLREHMDNSFVCRVLVPRDHVDGIPGYEMVPSYVVLDHDISPTAFIVRPKKTNNAISETRSIWARAFLD